VHTPQSVLAHTQALFWQVYPVGQVAGQVIAPPQPLPMGPPQ
jgi:hypothetical protein